MADVVSDNVAVAVAKVTGGSRKVGPWLEQLDHAERCALNPPYRPVAGPAGVALPNWQAGRSLDAVCNNAK